MKTVCTPLASVFFLLSFFPALPLFAQANHHPDIPASGPAAPADAAAEGAALLAKCDMYTNISCGTNLNNQSTVGAGNDFVLADYPNLPTASGFTGPDLLYRLQITAKTNVQIVMNITTSGEDLDMFLLTNCATPALKAYSGENNPAAGIGYKEVIDVNLDPGFYFLVVDGYDANQAGNFSLSVDCISTAIEPAADLTAAQKYWADDFENYNINANLDPQSNRWRRWSGSYAPGRVETSGGNEYARFTYATTPPDMIYSLNEGNVTGSDQPITSGRWRMSWRMQIPNGKKGYFNVLHQKPNDSGSGAVWAYEVYLNRNSPGDGHLVLAGNAGSTFKNFSNPTAATWFNVVSVIDLNKDSAELWINNNFVAAWKFSTASSGAPLNQLDGINFFAGASSSDDFLVDDLSIWRQPAGINCDNQPLGDLMCLANGKKYNGPSPAGCQLYSSLEYYPCETICDYGGTFIYRSQPRNGKFDYSDRAPGQLRLMQCVKDAYNGNVPQDLYADIYIFYHDDKASYNFAAISWENVPNSNTRCFIMQCHTYFSGPNLQKGAGGAAADCFYGPRCGCQVSPFAGTVFISSDPSFPSCAYYNLYQNCDNFYYIVVTGTLGETYSNLSVDPGGNCPNDVPELSCGTQQQLGVTEYFMFNSDLYYSTNWPDNAYPCYNGARTYMGGEAFYKIRVDKPKKITVTLESASAMGVFLYSFLCGRDCIQYAGTLPGTGKATLNATLDNGEYYLVVDTDNAIEDFFLISLDCENIPLYNPNFIKVLDFEETPPCPADLGNHHQITLPNQGNAWVRFDTSDFVQFLFPLTGGGKKSTEEITRQWTEPINNPQSFQIFGDQGGDSQECGFISGEKIYIRQIQADNGGARRLIDYVAQYAPPGGGNTAQDMFVTDGISQVTKLTPQEAVTFGLSGNEKLLNRFKDDSTIVEFNSNLPWAVKVIDHFPAGTGGWLSISKLSGSEGPTTIRFQTTQANNTYQPRSTLLKFYAIGKEFDYFQYVRVVQAGLCSAIEGLTVTSSAPNNTICRGDSITLTASAFGGNFLYHYYWQNTGQSQRVIKVAPQLSGYYTVIVTNPNYCDAFDTRAIYITVKDPPNVAATGGTLSCLNNTVTLNVATNATPPVSFIWQGPNGFISTVQNPTVSVPGIYQVTVTPAGSGSCKGTATATVTGDNTAPQISTSANGVLSCAAGAVTISAAAPNVPNPRFQWSGPGGFTSDQQNPLVTLAGNYVVTVTNQTNGCTATATVQVGSNYTAPVVGTSVSGKLLCTGAPVQISATSNVPNAVFDWLGPFGFNSAEQNPLVLNPGTYYVFVTNPDNGCSTEASVTVEADTNVPNASASGGILSCANPTAVLVGNSSSSGVNFEWTGPNNFFVINQSTVTVTAPGTYIFKVTFTATGCSKSVPVTVPEDKTPPGATATGGVIDCSNPNLMLKGNSSTPGIISWAWTGPNNFNSVQQNPQVSAGGSYTLTVTGPNGCTSSATTNVQENKTAPSAIIAPPGTLTCAQTSVQLNATQSSQGADFRYNWTSAGGNILAGATTLTPTVNQAGSYTLVVTNIANGCTGSATVNVPGSSDLPLADAGEPKTLTCAITMIQLNGTASTGPAYKYLWTGPGIVANPASLSPTVDKPGYYVLKVENTANQCVNSDSVYVSQDTARPVVTLPAPPTITCANNKTVEIIATTTDPAVVFEWFAPDGTPLGSSASVIANTAGLYQLIAVSEKTGCSDIQVLNVAVDTIIPSGGAGADKTICAGNSWVLGQGNSPDYQYQWSPAISLSNPTAASPVATPGGNQVYFVTITNPANKCIRTDAAEIRVSPKLDLFITVSSPLKCHGDSNGALFASGSGGTPPLTYKWSNGSESQQNANLAAGIYTATVTDLAGCSLTLPSALTEPDEITANYNVSPPTGGNPNNGLISVSPSGGTGGYSYQWFSNGMLLPGETFPVIKDLPSMTGYTVRVTDSNGCAKVFGPFSTVETQTPGWANAAIRVFPNPTSGVFKVQFDLTGRSAATEVQVHDMLGRLIQTRQGIIVQRDTWIFDLSAQQSGIYLLKFNINDAAPVVRSVSVIR